MEERAGGRFVGRVGIQYHRLWPGDAELGWMLDPAVWGRGYATEAGARARDHGFDVLRRDRLVSIIHPLNAPSQAVARRLGFAPWRTVPWDRGDVELEVWSRTAPATPPRAG